MYSQDENIVIVFNGEIYNYIELKEELITLGHTFRTSSDTEVIIKAYEEWGVDCQHKFNGMWAFAIWDNKKKTLFVSRDRIGEKPIHYSVWDNTFFFGSEIKSIHELGVPREVALEFTELYLVFTNIPAPYTFFKNIKKLLPGHYLWIENGNVQEKEYWDLPLIDENCMINDKNEVYEQFEYLLKDSVRIRMRSDVPYGSFLSGGMDSSGIVSLMSEISNAPINTFTIAFPFKRYDERQLARSVARKFNTIHHEETVNANSFNDFLNKLSFQFDEPFGDASSIPAFYVSKFARENVTMVLTGDGGDEILSGYNSFQGAKLSSIYSGFPQIIQHIIPATIKLISPLTKGSLRFELNRIKRFCESASIPFNQSSLIKKSFTDYFAIHEITKEMKCTSPEEYFSDFMSKCPYKDNFYKIMYLNHKFDLPNDFLVKVDRMSMANSIEARAPFLDYRLIEFMVRVDKNIKMQGWERKSILKKTIGKRLPESILSAPKKGFRMPLTEWFTDSYFSEIQTNLYTTNWSLNNKVIKNIIDDNSNGNKDNGTFIWSLMILKKIIENN
jgi:asparagine synthase (glutamine-hydrolysing)